MVGLVKNFSCNVIVENIDITVTNRDTGDIWPIPSVQVNIPAEGPSEFTKEITPDEFGEDIPGTYEIFVEIEAQEDEIVTSNNADIMFFSLINVPKKQPVPEGNIFFVPIIIIAVISIIILKSRK